MSSFLFNNFYFLLGFYDLFDDDYIEIPITVLDTSLYYILKYNGKTITLFKELVYFINNI